jgi:hypothetical protein
MQMTGQTECKWVGKAVQLPSLGAEGGGSGLCRWLGALKEQATILKEGQTKRFRIGGDTNVGLDIRPTSL